ncbi:MAG TPA: SRPBCC domain-containing protein [Anaerolineae bacterium]
MAAKTQTLKFKRTVKAPVAEVYRAFTNSTALREWLSDAAQVDLHKDGRIHLWWNNGYYATGEVTTFVPNKKVAFTWRGRGEPDETQVQVSLAEKNGSTVVTVAHARIGSGKTWAKAIKAITRGWERGLENLQSVIETGHDLRFTLRPMLGINVGEFNAETAGKLGVPVSEGIHLDGVLETMGAYAAGLRKGDVIVNMAGKKVTGWPSLTTALQAHRAGDEVKVVFYRGAEKQTVTMKLSARPLPDVPATAQGLADAMRKIDTDLDAQLAKAFAGVTEEETAHEPAPDEWSAKDVLCHLIAGERDTGAWIAELIGGHERWYDDWGGNIRTRHAGILATHPTVSSLLDALKCYEAETVAILAALPAKFVARKGTFWRMAYSLLQAPEHNDIHLEQIRAAIASARKR